MFVIKLIRSTSEDEKYPHTIMPPRPNLTVILVLCGSNYLFSGLDITAYHLIQKYLI